MVEHAFVGYFAGQPIKVKVGILPEYFDAMGTATKVYVMACYV